MFENRLHCSFDIHSEFVIIFFMTLTEIKKKKLNKKVNDFVKFTRYTKLERKLFK